MKSYSSREVIKILQGDGWYEVRVDGSHHHFRHPIKRGTVTVPHPKKDLPFGTVRNIFNQAGIEL
ncbi:MAG: type II toxin-antitoxin system HicA family toxin [Synergistaceae bacterium]|nr:type II toxin-antitoxin system HicA family toxin [Synergistaceae bacterium]